MRLLSTPGGLRTYRSLMTGSVGFVPTMGALHQGHLSLMARCRQECDQTIVSIFVNPLQFGPGEDYQVYPRTLEADLALCREAGVDLVFAPPVEVLLGDPERPRVQVVPPPAMLQTLCAPFRPGHFAGVLTIVSTLFHLVQPQRAYFGEKDIQQVRLIEQMVADLGMPITIVPCPTVRDPDGLALSSRNRYLSPHQRQQALGIPRGLQAARTAFLGGERSAAALIACVREVLAATPEVNVQYLQLVHPRTLAPLVALESEGILAMAAFVGSTRLIDHVVLSRPRPIIAIDGPAGAGKSTVARHVAYQLGLTYIDTGAMYRAFTWLALEKQIDLQDQVALAELAATTQIDLDPLLDPDTPVGIRINGQDVTRAIRSQAVTQAVSQVAACAAVRDYLVQQQQQLGSQGGVILEGRDIGTHVFPQAQLKFFLTASVEERASRRQKELAQQGEEVSVQDLADQIAKRDYQDSHRAIAPLRQAPDAIVIVTDSLTIEQVVQQIVERYREKTLE